VTQQCSTTTHRKALELAAYSDRWSRGTARTITGSVVAVNLFASDSEPGKVWMTRVDGAGCNCRGAQQSRSGICFHMVACALVTEQARAAFAAPTDVYDEDESLSYAF
jgi:hypothetical protein